MVPFENTWLIRLNKTLSQSIEVGCECGSLIECLPMLQEELGFILSTIKTLYGATVHKFCSCEVKIGRSEVQGHVQLHRKLEASLLQETVLGERDSGLLQRGNPGETWFFLGLRAKPTLKIKGLIMAMTQS